MVITIDINLAYLLTIASPGSNLGGVSNIFSAHPYLVKIRILTIIFLLGWFNHHLEKPFSPYSELVCGCIDPRGYKTSLRVGMLHTLVKVDGATPKIVAICTGKASS